MELWIRSQSKEELIKVYNVSINKDNNIIGNLVSDDNKSICDYWILGIYNTKERALEVLDEIQSILEPKKITNTEKDIYMYDEQLGNCLISCGYDIEKSDIQQLPTYVYEMPEE